MLGLRVGMFVGLQAGIACGMDKTLPAGTTTTLTISTVDSADPVLGGANFTYTIQITNIGALNATTVAVAITLDAGVTWVSSTGSGWSFGGSGSNRTATMATLTPGAATPIVITVTAAAAQIADFSTGISVTSDNAATITDTETTENVPIDGPDNWRCPRTAAGFTALGLAAPDLIYGCQDAQGSTVTEAAGGVALTAASRLGSAQVLPTFRTTVSGWTRKGILMDSTVANQGLCLNTSQGWNLGTQSFAVLAYFDVRNTDTSAHTAHYLAFGEGDPDTQNIVLYAPTSGTDKPVYRSENNSAGGAFDSEPSTMAALVVFNRTAGTSKVYTSVGDKLSATYIGAIVEHAIAYKAFAGLGPESSAAAYAMDEAVMYAVGFVGANAEFTDATAATYLQGLDVGTPWVVPTDGPSSWYVPSTPAHWAALDAIQMNRVNRHLVAPNSTWDLQEPAASPTVADTVGSLTLTVAFLNGPTLHATAAGWTRKCASFSAGGSKGQLGAAAGLGPDPTTTSSLWVGWWLNVTPTTALRQFMMIAGTGATNEVSANVETIAAGSFHYGKVALLSQDSSDVSGITEPIAFLWDRTNARAVLYTLNSKTTLTYTSITIVDGIKGFGGSILNTPAMKLLRADMWSGANAEQTDQQIRDMLTTIMQGTAPAW